MKLTDIAVRNAKPCKKTYTLSDGHGMFLEITPNGSKRWRLSFRYAGKQKRLSLGTYPNTSLKLARQKKQEFKELLAQGIDPSQYRKEQKAEKIKQHANTLEDVSRQWYEKQRNQWKESHAQRTLRRLEANVFPYIGKDPISEIKPPDLLKVLQKVENRGAAETAHRILRTLGQIFRYAVVTGKTEYDITPNLKGALTPYKKNHLAAITKPEEVAGLLNAIDGYQGTLITKCALQLAPLVFVRPGELRQAEWKEIDLNKGEWNIPASKMKMGNEHLVPLSKQAIEILKEVNSLTQTSPYVFPSVRTLSRPMSDNALNAALRRMGFSKEEMTTHGFRAMARTILDEVLGIRPDIIEHQLAHAVKDPNGRAYNRTSHLEARREMMQTWADYLDELKTNTK